MDIGQLISDAEPLIRHYGVLVVTVTFGSFGAPLPGESLLIGASVLAGRGDISFPALLFFAWPGAVLGDNIGYLIGKKPGIRASDQELKIKFSSFVKLPGASQSNSGAGGKKTEILLR